MELFDFFDGTDPGSEMLVDLQQKLSLSLARIDFCERKVEGMYERTEMRDAGGQPEDWPDEAFLHHEATVEHAAECAAAEKAEQPQAGTFAAMQAVAKQSTAGVRVSGTPAAAATTASVSGAPPAATQTHVLTATEEGSDAAKQSEGTSDEEEGAKSYPSGPL